MHIMSAPFAHSSDANELDEDENSGPACHTVINSYDNSNLTDLSDHDLLVSLKAANDSLLPGETYAVTSSELVLLKPKSQMLEAIFILNNSLVKHKMRLNFVIWNVFEQLIFENDEFITEENVIAVEKEFHRYFGYAKLNSYNLNLSVKNIKRKKLVVQSKKEVITALRFLSIYFSRVLETEIDLTTIEGLLFFFSVDDLSELEKRLEDLAEFKKVIAKKVTPLIRGKEARDEAIQERRSRNPLSDGDQFVNDLLSKHYGDRTQIIEQSTMTMIEKTITEKKVVDLINKIQLNNEKRNKFLQQIELVKSTGTESIKRRNVGYLLVLYEAYFEAIGEVPFHTELPKEKRAITRSQILLVFSLIRQHHHIHQVAEERFSEYVEKSDRTKARIERFHDDLETAQLLYNDHIDSEKINDIKVRTPSEEMANDEAQLDNLIALLTRLEIELDSAIEAALKNKRNHDIVHFEELNYRWRRIIANKQYEVSGSDYSRVSFTKDVVSYFSKQQELGSRFLAALSKSYVSATKSSGLRSLPNIHRDFRDIKLIMKHGKYRIIGKLVGGTIYFFYVYHADRGYTITDMNKLIENFEP